jgi:hypothetical protein
MHPKSVVKQIDYPIPLIGQHTVEPSVQALRKTRIVLGELDKIRELLAVTSVAAPPKAQRPTAL